MKGTPNTRSFWFRGSTLAFGGQVKQPFSETIDTQCSCVLPPTGGYAVASMESFSYKNIVSFASATSTVAGRRDTQDGGDTAETMVTVVIKGLNILGLITADTIVARMVSRHSENDADPMQTPFGSHFENLRIGGIPVAMHADTRLMKTGSYDELAQMQQMSPTTEDGTNTADFGKAYLAPLFNVDDSKTADWPAGCKPVGKNGIYLPGFGTAYFAEYLATRASRRITMLRVELGSPIVGSLVMAYADYNGHWYP